jgi:hypothetical protein
MSISNLVQVFKKSCPLVPGAALAQASTLSWVIRERLDEGRVVRVKIASLRRTKRAIEGILGPLGKQIVDGRGGIEQEFIPQCDDVVQ